MDYFNFIFDVYIEFDNMKYDFLCFRLLKP